jgi:hypothetical protein
MWVHCVANYMVVSYIYCVSRQELYSRLCGDLEANLFSLYGGLFLQTFTSQFLGLDTV